MRFTMLRTSAIPVFLCVATFGTPGPIDAQTLGMERKSDAKTPSTFPLWGELKPGPFPVGFKAIETYDFSRLAQAGVDFEGRVTGETAWPFQISIWYPAEPSPGSSRMLFREYAQLLASPVQRGAAGTPIERMKSFINVIVGRTRDLAARPTDRAIADLFEQKTAAFRNAAEKKGAFPVIIFTANAAYGKQVMCEYLASHGFIVVSSAEPLDPVIRNTTRIFGRESVARDLEFLMSHIKKMPNTNNRANGLLLWSSSSIGGLIFQLRNMHANAVLSIEGHEAFVNGAQALQESPYFDPARMRVPFMRMEIPNTLSGGWATDDRVLASLKYSERYYLTFHTMEHNDMGSSYAMMMGLVPDKKKSGYETVCRYALQFFNAYLRADESSMAFLRQPPAAHGLPQDVLSMGRKPALPAIPTRAEFLQLILDEEHIDKGVEVFTAARRDNPDAVLFEEWILNRLGYSYLRAEKPDLGIKIFRMIVAAYPQSANAFDSLGEAYSANNQRELAIASYKKSLELNPENSNAAEMIEKLQLNQ